MEANTQNRLANARSPYLQQHADNPVDWYEWGEEALAKAKQENKPLIISIGYAACHWCHVMAHESFSDPKIAELMNQHFICIKVDREERPDIDQIYMEAAQLITGRGGWPLNAFALPDGRPFYAATYFPPLQWSDVVRQLAGLFQSDYKRVLDAAESLMHGIQTNPFIVTEDDSLTIFTKSDYNETFAHLLSQVDFEQGGLKGAPKFMMPVGWEFLLQYYHHTGNEKALEAVIITLDAMSKGGIYDQIGGGFARYSTDVQWLVPHFEKMLYDNAQLVSLYAHAYQITQDKNYANIIEQTISFAERELMGPDGGFFSSIDADSEHVEGKYYVWTKEEFDATIDPEVAELMAEFYHITPSGNWESGRNILHYTTPKAQFAEKMGIDPDSFTELITRTNELLLLKRNKRIRPTTDDKILTAWNALMLTGYVDAYKASGNPAYRSTALRLAAFLEEKMLYEGKLFRNYKDGKATVDAFLDDYALLANAYIHLYEVTFDFHWLQLSRQLTDYTLKHFTSPNSEMVFYTSDLSDNLIARKIDYADNVIPASNSVFAHVLHKLGILFENNAYTERAESMLQRLGEQVIPGGTYFANWALLAGKLLYPSCEVVVTGEDAANVAINIQKHYLPDVVIAGGNIENLPLLKDRISSMQTNIYVCRNKLCNLPVHTVEEALKYLLTTKE